MKSEAQPLGNSQLHKVTAFIRNHNLYVLLVLSIVIASLLSEQFLTYQNITNLLSQMSIIGILAIAQMMVMLTAGIDLSHGSFIALGSVLLATTMDAGVPVAIAATFGCLTLLGFVNGFFANRGIHPFIVTLGMMGIARTLALVFSDGQTVKVPAAAFENIAYSTLFGIPVPIFIWFGVLLIFHRFLKYHPTGRHIYAVGGNQEAARLTGINVKKIKYVVYMLSGFLATISAMIYTSRIGAALPDKAVGYEMDSIAAAVIGGTSLFGGVGAVKGAMVGVIIYGVISNILNLMGVSPYFQQFLKGLIILAAVYINTRGQRDS